MDDTKLLVRSDDGLVCEAVVERRPGSRSCPSFKGPDGQTDVSSLEIKSERERESNVALDMPSTVTPPCLASNSVPCLSCCCAQDSGE